MVVCEKCKKLLEKLKEIHDDILKIELIASDYYSDLVEQCFLDWQYAEEGYGEIAERLGKLRKKIESILAK